MIPTGARQVGKMEMDGVCARKYTSHIWIYTSFPCYRAVLANDVIVSNENSNLGNDIVFYPRGSLNLGNRFNPCLGCIRLNWELIALRGRIASSVFSLSFSVFISLFYDPSILPGPDRHLSLLHLSSLSTPSTSALSNYSRFNTDRIESRRQERKLKGLDILLQYSQKYCNIFNEKHL